MDPPPVLRKALLKNTGKGEIAVKTWKEFSFVVNGFPVQARYTQENIEEIFKPLVRGFSEMQKAKGERLVAFLAAPPATGKSTLASFLARLSQELSCTPVQAVGLDGFHYHQDYILTHSVALEDGRILPMRQLKGSPETYDVPHFLEKVEALRRGDPLWPVYDRRLHDVIEDQVPVTAPIVLIEGNWLLFQEGGWRRLASKADYTVFIQAEETVLKERLLRRKMQGGLTREEAEAFYRTGDGVNVRRTLAGSGPADFSLKMEEDGSFSICK